jgi:hypothetical protein
MSMEAKGVGLAEAFEALRHEIALTCNVDAGERFQFDIGLIEVEFSVVATKARGINGGVQFGVVTVGGEGKCTREETHRVKVTLTPLDRKTGLPPRASEISG